MVIFLALSCFLNAQDVQWRGPDRDGKYPDTGLLKEWPEGGPRLILKKEGLGSGFGTPVLYQGMIYITGKRDGFDALTKLDLDGKIQWETIYGRIWEQSYPDTRSTPTIEDDRVYLMGGMGTVSCLDAVTGKILWQVNTHEKYEGEFHRWGAAESLLLLEDAVVSSPVGNRTAVVALDKKDGSPLWESPSVGGKRSYVSPLLINHNGKRQIVMISNKDAIGVDASGGEILWTYDLVTGHASRGDDRINTVTPLYHDGDIFITSGYDSESVMLTLSADGRKASLKWSDATLDTHHGGVVRVGGYLYGSNWVNNGNGNWVCQEWESGKVMYEEKWHNKGSIIYADGLCYIYEEKQGHVGLMEPVPDGLRIISSFRVDGGAGPHWAHMSIFDRKLFIRHGEVLFVYDIAAD